MYDGSETGADGDLVLRVGQSVRIGTERVIELQAAQRDAEPGRGDRAPDRDALARETAAHVERTGHEVDLEPDGGGRRAVVLQHVVRLRLPPPVVRRRHAGRDLGPAVLAAITLQRHPAE